MEKENYIEQWYDHMRLLKFEKGYHNNKYFIGLDQIFSELTNFFDTKNFEVNGKIDPNNWLLHILGNKQLNSICVANEIAELIRYFKTLDGSESYRLKNNKGEINFKELQEKLFELYVNYLLSTVGLLPEIGRHYVSTSGHNKEIDMVIKVKDVFYNVEVTKYYDGYKEALVDLGQNVILILRKIGDKYRVQPHEMLSGYFAFHSRDATAIKLNKAEFESKVGKLIKSFRVGQGIISVPAKKVTPKFESELESTYSDNYKRYPSILEGFNANVSFAMTWQFGNNHYHIETDVQIREEIKEANKRLLEKISKKLDQHRESPYKLLIVIGIEELFSSHEKSRAIPIRKENINSESIHGLLKNRAVLWLIFKQYNHKGVEYKSVIFGNNITEHTLIEKLNTINQEIIYSTKT